MRLLVLDVHGFPSDLQRRAVRQLPAFRRLQSVAHGVLVGPPPPCTMVPSVMDLLASSGPELTWCTVHPGHAASPWSSLLATDVELGILLDRAPDATVVLTSTRLLHPDAFSSFVGARPPRGVRWAQMPTLSTVAGVVSWLARRVSASDSCVPWPLPPPVSRQLDVTRTTSDVDPLNGRPLWIRVLVPRTNRLTNATVTMRFGIRDLVSDPTRWDAATDSERSHMATERTTWPTPEVDMWMRDAHDAHSADEDPEDVPADVEARSAALALVGPTVDVTVPPVLWLRSPLGRDASAAVRGTERSRWLPRALCEGLPSEIPTSPCVAWVPEERGASVVVVAERCPNGWEPTGEEATYVCADHVVHAIAVRRCGRADARPTERSERSVVRGRAREQLPRR